MYKSGPRWIPICVAFVGPDEPRIQMFHKLQIFDRLCMQTLAKPRNQIPPKMQVVLNSRKLISTKMKEPTELNLFWYTF